MSTTTSHYSLMIPDAGSEVVPPLEVFSPYTGDVIATVARADAKQVEQSLATAYSLFRDKKNWLSTDRRVEILERVASLMGERLDELVRIAASEGGKPWMDSRVEVNRAIAGIHLCVEAIHTDAGRVVPMSEPDPRVSRIAFTQKEPIGLVVAVSAFNHPLNLIVHQVAAAIAAGCPTIVKPASATPLSCLEFVAILRASGLPEAWCQVVVPESTDLATKMVVDSRVGFFSFIGSPGIGWSLRSQLAPGTRCALEHGGAAPVVVDASADLDKVIPAVLKGGYYHAGQVCVSVQRLFVHNSLFAEVAERLAEGIKSLQVGDPLSAETEIGPLIKPGEVTRVGQWVDEAVAEGATMPIGGQILEHNCYSPTLLLNPDPGSKVSQREIFGPVVCQYGYDHVDEAIDQANGLPFAFQAAVFAQDIDRAVAIYHKLDASAVMVNEHTAFRQDGMPFAGLRQSGEGIGGIAFTVEAMQIEKMMVIKSLKN